MNASSEHVTGYSIYSQGEVNVNETSCVVMLMAPVGPGNITVGYFRQSGSPSAPGINASVTLPVHIKIVDPSGQTIIEKDTITPTAFPIAFQARGQYKVYITNNGAEKSPIPIGSQFEQGNAQNREADKFVAAVTLTVIGAVLVAIGVALRSTSKRSIVKESK
jgi:hypothetical protein